MCVFGGLLKKLKYFMYKFLIWVSFGKKLAPSFFFAEEVGFEPTDPCGTPVFKTGAIGRSATLPY